MNSSHRLPLARRLPFFYGWIIVAGAFLGTFAGGGLHGFTFGVFMQPMSKDLGWSRAAITGALTIQTLTAAALGPVFGPLVDRHGPRLLMTGAAVTGGVACLALSRVQELWQFYLVFAIVGISGGAGMGGLVSQATIVKWFVRLRGRATAVGTMGTSVAGTVLAPLVAFIVFAYSWREAWLLMAAVFFGLLLPVAVLMQRQPEDVGLLPDGAKSEEEVKESYRRSGGRRSEHSWGLRQALRTRALWVLSLASIAGGIAIASIVLHEFAYVAEGFSAGVAAAVLSTHALMASVGRLVWGFLVERFHVRYCMAASYAGGAVGLGLLLTATSVPMVFAFAVIYGLCVGGQPVLSNVVLADYYGRDSIGTIRGVLTPLTAGATAAGPLLVARGYDVLGGYQEVFWGLLGLLLVAAGLVLMAKPPVRRGATAPASVG